MGLAIALLLALALGILLWRRGRLPAPAMMVTAGALALGVVGYALTGTPQRPGEPVARPDRAEDPNPSPIPSGSVDDFLAAALSAARDDRVRSATATLKSGLHQHPADARLWAQYGTMLVAGADGVVSPAARLALARARAADDRLPQPYYFEGLALAQQGRTREAARFWSAARERLPANGPWREDLDAQIRALEEQGQGPQQGQGR